MPNSFEYVTVLSALTADGVRTITLHRPDRLNAMNRQLIDDVAAAFKLSLIHISEPTRPY